MTTSMWRMNGLCRSMAGLLVLCTLLLSNEVLCQDDDAAPDASDADSTGSTAAPSDTAVTNASPASTMSSGGGSDGASAPPDDSVPATLVNVIITGPNGDTSATSAPESVVDDNDDAAAITEAPTEPKNLVVPEVECVDKENIPENTAVKATVDTGDCEATKTAIQANPAHWCNKDNCKLEIFQDGNTVFVASSDANHHTLASALQSEQLKDKLGLTKVQTPSSSGSSVFVGILITGLLAAVAITVGYFKCYRKTDAKGVKLAEEAVVDQENQGNTLVSVAPLNPPPETPEKPSVNGESPEAVKTESPPPTNGHSTAKTADTEL